ncbi:GNAT family N-acetyltransferase [Acinetobacter rudis]|uniref:GNAT family N-acetyltransferase n=1 Tax=Acinetobacter rudis TaxID=632955 RepID=A0AAW8J854_9GAMM|nr:GNAT family N-acetyltransferase [Acinetobacter rudis]MDQ8935366.1 GNAT family N-acetyltransferase [Acinetobacter rudis]MDQ8952324.1 GNAT family N-acetyltransferase [Acinetobacter rudis]MDQ9017629.1 GNAT family N-acetyltransferase [Acinetobacter rudis]
MIVRRACNDDLSALTVLFNEYRQFYQIQSEPQIAYQYLKQRLENQQSVIFIHIKDEQLTGFVVLYLGFSSIACKHFYILDDVYVRPQFRRQGSARQLIDTAILFARHNAAFKISLRTELNNVHSHRLYESMGFIRDNEYQEYHYYLNPRPLNQITPNGL